MINRTTPGHEFTALSENDVMKALDDPDPRNPIAIEVARLIDAYTENFAGHIGRLGYIPSAILRVRPSSPIEAIAMDLTIRAIQAELEQRPSG